MIVKLFTTCCGILNRKRTQQMMKDPEKQKEMTAKVEEKLKQGEKELADFEKKIEADKEQADEKPAAK
jgi:hypothetical protein